MQLLDCYGLKPEQFAEIAPGVSDPAAALEELKTRPGVAQAAIVAEVIQVKVTGVGDYDDSDEE